MGFTSLYATARETKQQRFSDECTCASEQALDTLLPQRPCMVARGCPVGTVSVGTPLPPARAGFSQ